LLLAGFLTAANSQNQWIAYHESFMLSNYADPHMKAPEDISGL